MSGFSRRAFGLSILLGVVAVPPSASGEEAAVAWRGQTVRVTPKRRIDIPGLLVLEKGRRVAGGAMQEEDGGAFVVVEQEGRTWDVPVPGRRPEGELVAADEQSVTISRDGKPRAIPREAIESLAVRTGHPSRWRGALLGAGIGFAIGGLIGIADGDDAPGLFSFTAEEKAVGLGGVLAVIGSLAGALHPPGAGWKVVELGSVKVSCGPALSRRGPGLALTVAF